MSETAPRDEMVDGAGRLRPHWRGLLDTLAGLGPDVLAERGRALDRALADEGIAGLLPGAGSDAGSGGWRCDPIPLIVPAPEFARLEAGLAQRARLLEAVLADIYGPQRLLAEGLLPPALIYANPAFLRACRTPGDGGGDGGDDARAGTRPHFLHLYAAELLRGPDGAWRVLADRTAFASGVSYALENRRTLARVLPELFRSREVRRLQPFMDAWQDALQRLAPPLAGNPGIALLTAGPADPLWFEHVVLARRLACALVEDGDLTVRDGVLHLKTLRGLQRVDVLLRKQDGRTIDSLELASGTGVPGLLDAARSGAVRIVNDPGTGLAEAPALAAFLPALARRLLGEELALPGVDTVWLGEPRARERVCRDLSGWFVRSALDGTVPPVAAGSLSERARGKLLDQIAALPWQFSASSVVPPSVVPCAAPGGGMEPRPVVLRLFLLHDGEGWRAMQGGLARVLSDQDALTGRLPRRGLCKDVWVPAEEDEVPLAGPGNLAVPALVPRRTQGDLPSRVADNFYWLGRYLERLEGGARLLRVTLAHLARPAPTGREIAELRLLTSCLVWAGLLPAEEAQVSNPGALAASLAYAAREGGSLPRQLGRILRLTRLLRDRLSEEMHAALLAGERGLTERLRAVPPGPAGSDALSRAAGEAVAFAATVSGLAAENMVRGGGRLFMDLGRRVERAQAVAAELARMLDVPGAASPGRLEPGLHLALELRDSVITYRGRYLTVVQPAPVLDLVLADEGNPRSLAYQLAALRDGLSEIGGDADEALAAAAEALLEDAYRMVRDVVRAGDQAAAASLLPPRLHAMETAVAELSNRLADRYFALLPAATRLGPDPDTDAARLRGAA